MGLAPVDASASATAAQTHAVCRAKDGFNIEQLASEYRALRASVLSGWMEACMPEPPPIDDMLRFNEAVDQALAESIASYAAHVHPCPQPADRHVEPRPAQPAAEHPDDGEVSAAARI